MSADGRIFANLRLLGKIKQNQFIRVNRAYNITSIEDNTYVNIIKSVALFDWWSNTRSCLEQIYIKNIPILIAKLIENNSKAELLSLRTLINESIEGVGNMKNMWIDEHLRVALLDTYIHDYAKIHVHKIEIYFDENKINYLRSE